VHARRMRVDCRDRLRQLHYILVSRLQVLKSAPGRARRTVGDRA
jgi:hypothetical protein